MVWVEALDGGNTLKPAPLRDRVLVLKAPFTGTPVELVKTEQRFSGLEWFEKGGLVLVSDYERKKRWRRTFVLNADNPSETPRNLWSRNVNDRYGDPGVPVTRELAAGHRVIRQYGDDIFLTGQGASPEGDR
ncbi:MAG: S9 family peptidase, partial [Blastocatellia bacterium]